MMKKIIRLGVLWFIIGAMYYVLEGIWRIPTNGGYANIVMLPIGGLCGILVGGINQNPRFYKMQVVWQALLGTIVVLVVEFLSGCFLNLYLGLGIWDYSDVPFNIMGQVCLLYGVLWFLLIPFGIWLEDSLRFEIWQEGKEYSLFTIYRELFTYQ